MVVIDDHKLYYLILRIIINNVEWIFFMTYKQRDDVVRVAVFCPAWGAELNELQSRGNFFYN
ncbi:hypothetical protein SU60_19795 [Vibrio mytili]|uniref:Uncharacterized protein n=1 Tax=Vibrio mytili TaxID=50718 RepID=A0A0C3E4K7_9VIBR|nr:hypothetical protein SU60_19795 [Vibrio mytili]